MREPKCSKKIDRIYLTVGHFQLCYRLKQNRKEKNYTIGFLAASRLNFSLKLDTKLTARKCSVNKSMSEMGDTLETQYQTV